MPNLDDMRDVRGGVVYAAAGVNPVTARSWTKTVGLALGTARPGGHPRYDAVDAAALQLMKHLTWNIGMEAAIAARVVNGARSALSEVIEIVLAEHDETQHWRSEGYPYLALRLTKPFEHGRHWLLRDGADLDLALTAGGTSLVLICLPAVIGKAVYGVQRVLAGSLKKSRK
jgi:hypothetical protein